MFVKNITFLGFNMNVISNCSPLVIEILKNTACSALGGYILGSHEKKTLRFMAINACAAVLFTGLNAACGKIITGGILACSLYLIVKNSNFENTKYKIVVIFTRQAFIYRFWIFLFA